MTNMLTTSWSQQVTVPDLGPGAGIRNVSLVSITAQRLNEIIPGGQERAETGVEMPRSRDWIVYVSAEWADRQTPPLITPNATAVITYGSGAYKLTRVVNVPAVGAVIHLTATYLDVNIELRPTGFAADGSVRLGAQVMPGRPTPNTLPQTFLPTPALPTDFLVPPFATKLWCAEVVAGILTQPTLVRFEYGPLGTPLGAFPPGLAAGQEDDGISVPQGADRIVVGTAGATALHLWWRVDT